MTQSDIAEKEEKSLELPCLQPTLSIVSYEANRIDERHTSETLYYEEEVDSVEEEVFDENIEEGNVETSDQEAVTSKQV